MATTISSPTVRRYTNNPIFYYWLAGAVIAVALILFFINRTIPIDSASPISTTIDAYRETGSAPSPIINDETGKNSIPPNNELPRPRK